MSMPPDFILLDPWRSVHDSEALSRELQRELTNEHILHGIEAEAVAVRRDCDDVLFELPGHEMALAVIHLTWQVESSPSWPSARYFRSWEEWSAQCMVPDHQESGESD